MADDGTSAQVEKKKEHEVGKAAIVHPLASTRWVMPDIGALSFTPMEPGNDNKTHFMCNGGSEMRFGYCEWDDKNIRFVVERTAQHEQMRVKIPLFVAALGEINRWTTQEKRLTLHRDNGTPFVFQQAA